MAREHIYQPVTEPQAKEAVFQQISLIERQLLERNDLNPMEREQLLLQLEALGMLGAASGRGRGQ